MRQPIVVFLGVALLSAGAAMETTKSAGDGAQALILGLYELEEWHTDAAVLKPPQIYGRFILVDGTVATILRNDAQANRRTTSTSVGHYAIDNTHFAYGYENASSFIETTNGVTASHKTPWEGMRSFAIQATPDAVTLRSEGGQEFVFTRAGLTDYEKAGTPLRVYRRISHP